MVAGGLRVNGGILPGSEFVIGDIITKLPEEGNLYRDIVVFKVR